MKEISLKAFKSIANFFFSLWKKICMVSPTDTVWQQICIFVIILIATFTFLFGGVYFSIICLKEAGVIKQDRVKHRPHISREIGETNVDKYEN